MQKGEIEETLPSSQLSFRMKLSLTTTKETKRTTIFHYNKNIGVDR